MNIQITRVSLLNAPGQEQDNLLPAYEVQMEARRELFTQPFRLSLDNEANTLKLFHGSELIWEYTQGDTVNGGECANAEQANGRIIEAIHYT